MKLKYYLTRLDVVLASNRAILLNRPLIAIFALVNAWLIGSSALELLEEGKNIAFVLIFSALQLGIWIAFFVIGVAAVNALQLLVTKGKGILGEHELKISDQGLTERTEYNESLHKWSGVKGICETSKFYLIRVNEAGGSLHVVPKKNRIIEGELESFMQELRRRTKKA